LFFHSIICGERYYIYQTIGVPNTIRGGWGSRYENLGFLISYEKESSDI